MRRTLFALSLLLAAGSAQAQTEPAVLQMDFDHFTATATMAGTKVRFAAAAGVLQYEFAKPETSALALSLDTSSLDVPAIKTALDAQNFPEIRISSTGPSTGPKDGTVTYPVIITIASVTKPGTLQVSFKPGPRGSFNVHAEGAFDGADFSLKGKPGPISIAVDAPFVRLAR